MLSLGILLGLLGAMYLLPIFDFVLFWVEMKKALLQARTQGKIDEMHPKQQTFAMGFQSDDEDYEEYEEVEEE